MADVNDRRFAPEFLKERAMKTTLNRLLVAAAVLVLGLGSAAQVQAQSVVTCTVPFAFSLGGQVFQSGAYSFTLDHEAGSKIVVLRRWDGSDPRVLQAGVEDEPWSVGTRLTFHRIGNRYLLTSFTVAGDAISLHFRPTRAERELMASGRNEVVTVMANR
jgi:hypothetical protein